jgi:FkbM family methyltransferase
MPFISYAQNYEDVMLCRALGDVDRGFYVDVGAADPEEWSVTRAFYDRGWSGINVEPLEEYFNKLTLARPRDTNLKVAVGREAGLRTLHAIAGTGLSTFNPEIAAGHQAAGWRAYETIVPVLTLAKILDDCESQIIHFLKIDVEGAEAEVLEGLNLERLRPWIIVVEATKPFSTVSTRGEWEHLITSQSYGFAYFDGLNCFYVADEIPGLKERLVAPPNVFDDFVRWSEWTSGQKAAALDQELCGVRGHTQGLEAALKVEKNYSANLHIALEVEKNYSANLQNALQAEKAQSANLQNALQAEKAQSANLQNALQAEQAMVAFLNNAWQTRLDHLHVSIRHLESQLAVPSIDRALGRAAWRLREMGDRLTGGGIRALAKRVLPTFLRPCLSLAARHPRLAAVPRGMLKPFPRLTTALYRLAAPPPHALATAGSPGSALASNADNAPLPSEDSIAPTTAASADISSLAPKGESLPPEDPIVATLPVSARASYLNLQSAMSNGGSRSHTP